ncbi:hypothetical protein I8H84_00705 [Candidatus Saccharibacteria bacterium]|nr:hypothetical protein [Candidatus Saccharibacteria bacterium]MBH1972467.1 hypothetical protein [Candidatus Saccharibacteria bacterium]MBH1990191.1 hypothetical protein [Candidatus Saccharibacteria bacterium]
MLTSFKARLQKFMKSLGLGSKRVTLPVAQFFGKTFSYIGHFFKIVDRKSPTFLRKTYRFVGRPFVRLAKRIGFFKRRRPHRSFRLTRRRDYKRSLVLPGYWSFTNYVRSTLWRHKAIFGLLALTYLILTVVISGIGAQESYANLSATLKESGGELFDGNWGQVASAGLLLLTTVTTGLTPNVTQAQTVLGGLVVFFGWLTVVWLLRNLLAGRKVKLRDGLYNSGSPILSTVIVGIVLAVQLLPISLAIILYSAAASTGLLDGGVEAMLFWIVAGLLVIMSLYWITSTIIALVVVTLPGMYPFHAVKTAGDLVVGRRLRILLRLLWLGVMVIVLWLIILIPIILLDGKIKELWPVVNWLPLVPLTVLTMASFTLIFVASYVYLLYRKVVDDDASPA